jgi:pimeloyl-ACP methyl ester carboxylesterase
MALISSGGFGREVHPLLRALSLPGAGASLRLLTMRPTLGLLAGTARLARATGARGAARMIRGLQLPLANLHDRGRRAAMIRTLRSVIGRGGQCVCALDRLYLLRRVPALVVWGTRDRLIPVHHASAVLASNPGAELVLLDGIGHLPHLTRADFVAERLSSFINEAAPGEAPGAADNRASGPSSARWPAPLPVRAAHAST